MIRFTCTAILLLAVGAHLFSQGQPDSLKTQSIREISIKAPRETLQRLPELQKTYLWAGKKNEVIQVQNIDANITEKTPRQIFAKVPGVFVYDMDGAGNQTNISTRGLDPHRGWEFNVRTNGIITNSDVYGYPASHFSLPMEAIGRIELVRGTGALQYGAQFGGMLNYVIKDPDTSKTLGFETVNAAGSFGLFSTYNAVGGKTGKWQYYAFYSKRVSDGYRQNSHSEYDGQGVLLKYMPTAGLSLRAELLRSNYIYQLPGPLTDAMFAADPRLATRARNHYSPEIYIPSLTLDWQIGARTFLTWQVSAVLGQRRSVMFDRPATVPDTINQNTLAYNARQVDIDGFNSYTSELRLSQQYDLFGQTAALVAGMQYFNNDLHRRQLGKGTTGSDFDLSIAPDSWVRNLHFKTQNLAFFAENKFQITPAFFISPGVRFESGTSRVSGTITYYDPNELPNKIEHLFPLLGVNTGINIGIAHHLYAGWSQAYRPVIFKDIIPGSIFERTEKNLKDALGYNLELGWRGAAGPFKWDVSAFRLQYNNRLGSLSVEQDSIFYILRTNIGNSVTQGLEFFGEYGFELTEHLRCNVFSSTSWFHARYHDAAIRTGNQNRDISGNQVESVPEWISRNGLNIRYKDLSVSWLYSYTGETFADPLNTVEPSATGAVGLVPAYGLLDLNMTFRLFSNIVLRFNVNNLTNKQYFTKRPAFYPGPGVWPSDGRSVQFSIQLKI